MVTKQNKISAAKFQKQLKLRRKLAYDLLKPQLNYDKEYDILFISFAGNRKCNSTVELTSDLRMDLDDKGTIIAVEICNFSEYQRRNKI